MERPSGSSWKLTVRCAGCGAELNVEPDRPWVDCEFCHATSTVDLGGVATCFRLHDALDQEASLAKIKGWIRERGLLEAATEVEASAQLLIPFWTIQTPAGERSLLAIDQADLPLLPNTHQPAGQLEPIDQDAVEASGAQLLEPTVPLPSALARIDAEPTSPASLVYAPMTPYRYRYGDLSYHALVDEATGVVHALSWPRPKNPRLDRKLGVMLAAAFLVDLGLAALLPGLLLPLLACAAAALPLWWILSRSIETSGAASRP